MNRIYLISIICLLFASCTKRELTVEGTVTGGEGKLLTFEKAAVAQTSFIDTLTLKAGGKFKFKTDAVNHPEFFILKLDNQIINIAADSSETITIDANANSFATDYTVKGSRQTENIKDITGKGIKFRRSLASLNEAYNSKSITPQAFTDSVNVLLKEYKDGVSQYIYENPSSTGAYYALLQKINGLIVFDPYSDEDYKAFGAVATGWDTYHKESDRARQLVQITLNALSQRKKTVNPNESVSVVEQNNIEIVLPNINGKDVKLSDLLGKIVLLNFTAYGAEYSGPYNMGLNKLYEKYKSKGLEIYQVSLDSDEHF